MKKLLFIFTAIVLISIGFLTSCKEKDIDDLYIKVGNTSGKVENPVQYDNVVGMKLIWFESVSQYSVLASADRKEDGFTIVLPVMLEPNYLSSLNINGLNIIDPPTTMTVSNNNVKVFTVSNLYGVNKDGNVVTFFRPSAIDDDGNIKDVYFTYVDSDVTISGYTESNFTVIPTDGYTGPDEWKKTTTYSIEWKKGWNVWCISNYWDTPKATVTEQYSTHPISILKWDGEKNNYEFNVN